MVESEAEVVRKIFEMKKNFDETLSFHDFRMVFGETHTNILFDVVIPFGSKITLEDVRKELEEKYKNEEMKYFFVLGLDRI